MRTPNYVAATGRTTVNFHDPDGGRMQMVDAAQGAAIGGLARYVAPALRPPARAGRIGKADVPL